jgi:MOSC domain-containing protein YiiM
MTRCPICRWSATEVTPNDLGGTLRSIGGRWRWATEGLDDAALAAEQLSDGTSLTDLATRLVQILDGRPHETLVPTAIQPAIDDAALGAAAEVQTTDDLAGLHDRAHDASHVLREAGRLVHAFGWGAPTSTGVVTGIHTSWGGVPKLPVERATISLRGLEGDRQKERRHHGRLWQAVSLWSAEVIDDLRREGHDIAPGAAGENLTLAGLDWSTVRPGARLRVGPEVVLEIASWASPCSKIAHCFTGRDFNRIDHDRRPGWARAYSAVLVDGDVTRGDEAVLEPADQRSDGPTPTNGRRPA